MHETTKTEARLETVIRPASELDRAEIDRIINLVNASYVRHDWLFPDERTDYEDFQQEVTGQRLVLLFSEPRNELMGSSFIKPDGEALFIGMVAVDTTRQGQGYGAKLMGTIEAIARQEEFAKLRLTTVVELGNAEYYQRFGFQIITEETLPPGRWSATRSFTHVTMEKQL